LGEKIKKKNKNTTVIDNKFCWVFFALYSHISLLKKTFDNESLVRTLVDIIFRKNKKIFKIILFVVLYFSSVITDEAELWVEATEIAK